MYDNVTFKMSMLDFGEVELSYIAAKLEKPKQTIDKKRLYVTTEGRVKNLQVRIRSIAENDVINDITISGSLPKYLRGNNIRNLSRLETKLVVEELQKALGLPIKQAKVTKLEFGDTFEMSHPVDMYLNSFGDIPRMTKGYIGSTLYYRSNYDRDRQPQRELVFYDKGKESGLPDKNLLRYELKYNNHVDRQTKWTVTAETLYNEDFYRQMVVTYQEGYYSIVKSKQMSSIITIQKGIRLSKACDIIFAIALNRMGNDEVNKCINAFKAQGIFDDKKSEYSRLKRRIKEVRQQAGETADVTLELDSLIADLSNDV